MQNYIKFRGYNLKNGKAYQSIYEVDKIRLYDDFCDFEEDADWQDLLNCIADAISYEEEAIYCYGEEDDGWMRVLEAFEYDVTNGVIPALIAIDIEEDDDDQYTREELLDVMHGYLTMIKRDRDNGTFYKNARVTLDDITVSVKHVLKKNPCNSQNGRDVAKGHYTREQLLGVMECYLDMATDKYP
jgi:hypothetical protein